MPPAQPPPTDAATDLRSVLSRYRKWSLGFYVEPFWATLSPIPPCAQGLFLYAHVGPQTGMIPGVFRIGQAAWAELLGWDLDAFRQALAELQAAGLVVADWTHRVVFVPTAIRLNLPASPNVVKHWATTWAELPDCPVKWYAGNAIAAALQAKGLSEAFLQAFDDACPRPGTAPSRKPSRKASRKPSRMASPNQEQEHETRDTRHEQDKTPEGVASAPPAAFDRFWCAYPKKVAKAAARKAWAKLAPDAATADAILAAVDEQSRSVQWTKDGGQFIPHPTTWLNGCRWDDVPPPADTGHAAGPPPLADVHLRPDGTPAAGVTPAAADEIFNRFFADQAAARCRNRPESAPPGGATK